MRFTFYGDSEAIADANDGMAVLLDRIEWDDYGFGTTFSLSVSLAGSWAYLGTTKIAKRGMTSEGAYGPTHFTEMNFPFSELGDDYFSLGQDAGLYQSLVSLLAPEAARTLLQAIRDLAATPGLLEGVLEETVAYKSLLRNVTVRTVRDQYQRILEGEVSPQPFTLDYAMRPHDAATPRMKFTVDPSWTLPSNVHVIIGSNGTGKTTTLQNIRWALDPSDLARYEPAYLSISDREQIAGLVSVSFSAFDVFPVQRREMQDQADFRVTTVNLPWDLQERPEPRPKHASQEDDEDVDVDRWVPGRTGSTTVRDKQLAHYRQTVAECLQNRKDRLMRALEFLADADLVLNAHGIRDEASLKDVDFPSLSSGHKIVLLTVLSLVRYCEEKTLVLIDEPESHLHPPLLGAFTRALSWLMTDTNGLAIVATHSPVVLQEVPRRCAWKVWSAGLESYVEQPSIETFGENLGILTQEVFGLEMNKSGYHALLAEIARSFTTYEEALEAVGGEIGDEAKLVLRSMVRRQRMA